MNRDELIEHQREEIKALKAANLDLQIHFDTMKAELYGFKVTQDRDSFISWMLSFKHPVLGWLELESFCLGDDHSTYADEYIQGAWVVYNAKLLKAGN